MEGGWKGVLQVYRGQGLHSRSAGTTRVCRFGCSLRRIACLPSGHSPNRARDPVLLWAQTSEASLESRDLGHWPDGGERRPLGDCFSLPAVGLDRGVWEIRHGIRRGLRLFDRQIAAPIEYKLLGKLVRTVALEVELGRVPEI